MNLVKSEVYQLTNKLIFLSNFLLIILPYIKLYWLQKNQRQDLVIHTSTMKRQMCKDFKQIVSLQLPLQHQGPGKKFEKKTDTTVGCPSIK